MEKDFLLEELQKSVSKCTASILYMPAKNEMDYNDPSFPLELPKNNLLVPKDKNSNPFKWAASSIAKFKNTEVCILIPGMWFDIYGTRHGKGGGWYDQFLSKIPSTWLKIGVIDTSQMSPTKLIRQDWDEPVDWILVRDKASWQVYKA